MKVDTRHNLESSSLCSRNVQWEAIARYVLIRY